MDDREKIAKKMEEVDRRRMKIRIDEEIDKYRLASLLLVGHSVVRSCSVQKTFLLLYLRVLALLAA